MRKYPTGLPMLLSLTSSPPNFPLAHSPLATTSFLLFISASCCSLTNYPKIKWLKTTLCYFLWLHKLTDFSWAFLLRVSCVAAVQCQLGLKLSEGSGGWASTRAHSPLHVPWASHSMTARGVSVLLVNITRARATGGRKQKFLGQVRATLELAP